jgi:phage repressor protein C with HTH and peptisase S24 domain
LKKVRGDRSQREIAAALDVAVNTWRRYEMGEREPSTELLRGLAGMGWNPTWVLTGEGEERLAPEGEAEAEGAATGGDAEAPRRGRASNSPQRAQAALDVGQPDVGDYVFVPHLSVSASAGHGQIIDSEQIVAWMAFRRSYLQMLGVPARAACLIRVRGDSMYPDLREGDTVLVDTTDTTPTRRPRIYVMREPGTEHLIVKRITRAEDGALQISGADHWPPQVIPPDGPQPLLVGRVRWSGRTWD